MKGGKLKLIQFFILLIVGAANVYLALFIRDYFGYENVPQWVSLLYLIFFAATIGYSYSRFIASGTKP